MDLATHVALAKEGGGRRRTSQMWTEKYPPTSLEQSLHPLIIVLKYSYCFYCVALFLRKETEVDNLIPLLLQMYCNNVI